MTAADRFDRLFADMLADVAQPAYPDYIDDVLDVATRRPQRPAWTFPERWLPMRTLAESVPFAPRLPWRALAIVALLALLVAVALLAIAIGTQPRLAPPFGPAANGQIAYMVDGDIYARAGIDGPAQVIVGGDALDVYPFFARDGSRFAFFRIDREGTDTLPEIARLFVADPDGTGQRVVFGPASFLDAAWSPNGDELAVLEEIDGDRRLSIVDVDTGSARTLPFEGEILGRVFWRPPDGHELVFLARPSLLAPGFYAMGADGTAPRRISGEGTTIRETNNIALTPDGRRLVYSSFDDVITIRLVDLETGDVQVFGRNMAPLGPGQVHAGGVQISADGKTLVFGRYWDEDFQEERINHQIWTASIDGDGSDAVPISPVLRTQSGRDPFLVLLAPDGSQVLVHHLDTEDSWITDFAGIRQQEVDLGSFYDTDWQRMAP